MNPSKIWRNNKWRVDLRAYTRDFQKKFSIKEKLTISPGSVYAISYKIDRSVPTDKHHVTPLIISFGRFKDDEGKNYTRGLNLFYLNNSQKLEILDETYKFIHLSPDARVAPMIKIHEKWMKIVPYAFKNFEERRISGISEILNEEWGMIPLLKDYLYGNFNAIALNEDFIAEEKQPRKIQKAKSPQENVKEDEYDDQEYLSDTPVTSEFIDNDIDFDDI